jgi:hypothetical protein
MMTNIIFGTLATGDLAMMNDMLRAAWQEDRTEIRIIKDRIYSFCPYITGGAFAVTAFLLGRDLKFLTDGVEDLHLLVDPAFIILLWVLFITCIA